MQSKEASKEAKIFSLIKNNYLCKKCLSISVRPCIPKALTPSGRRDTFILLRVQGRVVYTFVLLQRECVGGRCGSGSVVTFDVLI